MNLTVFLLSSVADKISPPKGLWEMLLRLLSGVIPTYVWAIIVFTILLKIVLSPLDFFQRFKMKKNERLTKKLQPEMDKLARQYGDNKAELQRKQFQMQKAAGFSYFSACIPMILTMVVFITFFAGMRNISQYEEFTQYVNRYDIYTTTYGQITGLSIEGVPLVDDEGSPIVKNGQMDGLIGERWSSYQELFNNGGEQNTQLESAYQAYTQFADYDSFLSDYLQRLSLRSTALSALDIADDNAYTIDIKDAQNKYKTDFIYSFSAQNQAEQDEFDIALGNYLSAVNAKLAQIDTDSIIGSINTLEQFKQLYDEIYNQIPQAFTHIKTIISIAEPVAAQMVYDDYIAQNPGFLWIKSIWISDVPWKRAVPNYSDFRNSVSSYMASNKGGLSDTVFDELKKENTYNKVMAKVIEDESLSGTNGYLILAIIAVGLSFLSQFITTRQQKRSGTAATSNTTFKMMMFIMPLMIGVFAVVSTAAFSVYMITNSIMTLLINLLSTFIISQIYKKERQEEINSSGVIKYGRKDPNDTRKN